MIDPKSRTAVGMITLATDDGARMAHLAEVCTFAREVRGPYGLHRPI